jgi:putative nucleotidyltransferase with HDIG domain
VDFYEIWRSFSVKDRMVGKEASYGNMEEFILVDLEKELEHGMRVSNLAAMTARELGECEEYCREIAIAGMLHDVGKLRLSVYMYGRKKDALKIDEMNIVRQHSRFSYEVVKKEGYSTTIQNAVLHHHENCDGSGYPDHLKADMIPLGARILRVCDVFAALTENRPYRKAFPPDVAMEMVIDEVKNFDMRIFLAFQRVANGDEMKKVTTGWSFEKPVSIQWNEMLH